MFSMVRFTKEHGNKIKSTGLVNLLGQMEIVILVNGTKINVMDNAYILGVEEIDTRVSGTMSKNMDLANIKM